MNDSLNKKKLRSLLRTARNEVTAENLEKRSLLMAGHLRSWLRDQQFSGVVFGYSPIQNEPDLRSCLTSNQYKSALPRVLDANSMNFYPYHQGDILELSSKGILEPKISQPLVPDPCDVLLMPALGYTPSGYRLGYGAGYYDRYLSNLSKHPILVIVALNQGKIDAGDIHFENHDIKAHWILTEVGICKASAVDTTR
jgi:5-formyltetrahydrofolate cyclo-ligase